LNGFVLKSVLTFITIIFLHIVLNAQNNYVNIIGRVVDAQTNESLPFTNIYIKDSETGVSSDNEGLFTLTNINKDSKVVISHLGYKTEILNVSDFIEGYYKRIYLAPKDVLLQEVAVYANNNSSGNNFEVSSLSLQSEKIEKTTSVMPDVLRSLQSLPGISTNNEFSAEFNVRGGNKDENLIMVNGSEVYEPYHMKEAPNASIGVFNVALINKVTFVPGGFSARYGDRLSSVANIEYREGNRERYKGNASVSLAFVDGYIEGPLSKKGAFIFGARKTYMEYMLKNIDFGYDEVQRVQPSFYDIQGVLSYDLSNSDKLRLAFIHSADNFRYNPDKVESRREFNGLFKGKNATFVQQYSSSEDNIGNYYSTMIDVQSINIFSNKLFLKSNISYYDQIDDELRVYNNYFSQDIKTDKLFFETKRTSDRAIVYTNVRTLELKTALDYQVTPFYETKTGISVKNVIFKHNIDRTKYLNNLNNINDFGDTVHYTGEQGGQKVGNDSLDANSYKLAGYLENLFQLGDNVIINAGARFDYFDLNKELTFSPRVNLSYSTNFGTVLRAAWGHYYQSPIYSQLAYSVASDTNTKAQKAIHYVIGIEQNFNLSKIEMSTLKVKLDLFYKDYENIISSYYSHFDRLFYTLENDAVGNSKGVDVYILLNIPGFYTWISYSYLEAKEDNLFDEISEYPRHTNQLHTFSWVADFNLGKGWGLNTRFNYGSGYPYTPKKAIYNKGELRYGWARDDMTSEYLPAYKRFDFRISKDIKYNSFTLKTFIDVSNAFNFENIRGYDYSFDKAGNPKVTKIALWPILPSFGIRVEG
jgi:hypothetical protein